MSDQPPAVGTPTDLLIDRLENYYDFACEGGPLRNCADWQQLKAAIQVPAPDLSVGTSQLEIDPFLHLKRIDLREWLRDRLKQYQHSERRRAFRDILGLIEEYEVDVQIVLCACCDNPATRDVEGIKLCDICKR